MEKDHIVACSVMGLLGLLSAALSFAAEATKTRASQIKPISQSNSKFGQSLCTYPYSPATGLAAGAAVTLLVTRFIKGGCFKSNSSWTGICTIVSWASFLIALVMLVISAAHNAGVLWGCSAVPPGVFAGAGVVSLVSVALGISSYLRLESERVRIGSLDGPAAAPNQQFPNHPLYDHRRRMAMATSMARARANG